MYAFFSISKLLVLKLFTDCEILIMVHKYLLCIFNTFDNFTGLSSISTNTLRPWGSNDKYPRRYIHYGVTRMKLKLR